MDFDFTDEQLALRAAVQRWVERGYGFARRQALTRAGGKTRAVYDELAALGLAGLTVAPAHGGLGCGAVEAMVVMEELGRGLVQTPYAQAALIAPALLALAPAGLQTAWLARVADASALVVPATQERAARYRLAHVTARARHGADGWRLDGHKTVVAAGDEADAYLVPARSAGADDDAQGIALFLVERGAAGLTVRGYPTQDGGRAADLRLQASPAALITLDGHAALQGAQDIGIAAVGAEAVGLMEQLLALTVEHLNTRRQFGVPLASFQALRHRVADIKMQLELGRSMSYYASLRLGDAPALRRRALSQAKVQLGQAMRHVGQQCVQLHGAIGVTDDCIVSHYFKRLTVLEMSHGDSLHHLAEVSAAMQDSAGVFA